MDKTIFFIGPVILHTIFNIQTRCIPNVKTFTKFPKGLIEALKFVLNTYPYSYHPNEKLTYVYCLYVYANKMKLLLYCA